MKILEKRLIDIERLSHYISINPQTIRNRLCSGTFLVKPLKSFGKKLLWDKRDVDQYINKSKQKG